MEHARRAVLSTLDTRGRPHTVPVCFAVSGEEIATPIDGKPKRDRVLARVRNVQANAAATLLFDRWDEDWTRLGWVMLRGKARLETPGPAAALLAERYPQYRGMPGPEALIVVRPEQISWWTWQ